MSAAALAAGNAVILKPSDKTPWCGEGLYHCLADAGLPVGLVYADSRAMIRDRAFALKHTQMYAPRTMQHFVTNVRVLEASGTRIKAQSNYLLLQTLVEGPTTIHQAGRYYDTFVRASGGLLLKERQCVYDTVLIANDLVLPV
jgi:3-phenylpropionate/cinnamic acid dioxygenase small subunit